jgi:hypothetical protein
MLPSEMNLGRRPCRIDSEWLRGMSLGSADSSFNERGGGRTTLRKSERIRRAGVLVARTGDDYGNVPSDFGAGALSAGPLGVRGD